MRQSVWSVLAVVFVLSAAPAFAQDESKAEVAFGYTFLRDHTLEETSTWGWMVSPAAHLNRWFSVAADVGGNYKTVNNFSVSETAILGGPRVRYSWSSGAVYFQMLFGVDKSNYDGDTFSGPAWQTGIGVDLSLAPRWAFRFETGGRRQKIDEDTYPFWRGVFGVVYRVGAE